MKKNILCLNARVFILVGILNLPCAAFTQTTIINGQVANASTIPANTSIIINAGGTLNMDAARTFSNVTTANTGTSNISGTAALTITNTLSIAGANTLSIQPPVTTINLVTENLNNQTSGLEGTGNISVSTLTINGVDNVNATLAIGSALLVQTGSIMAGNGNGSTNYSLNLGSNGNLKISGIIETGGNGLDNFTSGAGATVEYNGGAPQTIFDGGYSNLTLSGAGIKSLAGNISMAGNLLLAPGSILTLGGNDLTIVSFNDRTVTINGRMNINGNGRLNQFILGNAILAMGAEGYLSLTDNEAGAGFLGFPSFDLYSLNANSTVEFGATNDNQTIADIPSPGYGNLIFSGAGSRTAASALDIQGDLTITSGTFVPGNFTHNLKGDWIRNGGVFQIGTSTINLNGSSVQAIGGTVSTVFNNLSINSAAGVLLSQNVTVGGGAFGILTLTNGIVTTTSSSLLTMNAGSSVAGSSNTSFINGPMAKIGATAFTFPVGKPGTGIRPIGISAPSTSSTFRAEFYRIKPTTAYTGAALGAGMTKISSCEYWTMDRTSGVGTARLTLSWAPASNCGGGDYITNPLTLKVARHNGLIPGTWTDAGYFNSTPAAPPYASGTVTSGIVSAFSAFAIATTNAVENPLPVIFANVRVVEKDNGVEIGWSNLTEKDVLNYSIERSTNGGDFTIIAQQQAINNANDKADYLAFDAAPVAGVNYYRIRVEELGGKVTYTRILRVNLKNSALSLQLYPNPVTGRQVTISLANLKRGQYYLKVVGANGQDVFRQNINSFGTRITQVIDLPAALRSGAYHMVITGDGYNESKMFIVQ